MRWLLTIVVFLASLTPSLAADLPSQPLDLPMAVVPDHGPWSFDLIDFREEQRLARVTPRVDVDPHSFFVVKHHLGIAGGYDNGVAHGSIGYYLTVAEWGRWNFGVPSVEIGLGRYPVIDRRTRQPTNAEQMTVLISLTSAHYRLGYIQTWGVHCYLNLEQVFDLHENRTLSQFGLSFSTK